MAILNTSGFFKDQLQVWENTQRIHGHSIKEMFVFLFLDSHREAWRGSQMRFEKQQRFCFKLEKVTGRHCTTGWRTAANF